LTDDLVHFATHGLFNPEAPMFSGVVTAPVDKEPSRLTVYDFADIRMSARTVVLSACETSLGSASGGDEVAGLTRSLLIAGANTVVSSLWKVSDKSTALLAQEFHRRLIAGDPPAVALRLASLEVRKQFPDPYYWAPFMVTGVI
jgi:CHAT domain-containing protein